VKLQDAGWIARPSRDFVADCFEREDGRSFDRRDLAVRHAGSWALV